MTICTIFVAIPRDLIKTFPPVAKLTYKEPTKDVAKC